MEQEKTSYQWNAGDYAKHSNAQNKWAKELMSGLSLKGNECLLDIGCGDGRITAELASYLHAGFVTGIDSSEEMISLARKKFPSDKYPNLSFFNLDARKLTFCQKFDVVFSNAALHWILDHRPVLTGIYRSLKPGGQAVVQMGGKGNASGVVDVVHEVIKKIEWRKYFENFSFPYGFYAIEEYEPWLKEAGFDVVTLELKPRDMVHESEKEFKGWFRTTWLPYLQRLPIQARESFIDVITEKYLRANPPDQGGHIHTGMKRLEFVAAK